MLVSNDAQLRQQVADGIPGLAALGLDDFVRVLCNEDLEAVSAVIDALVSKRRNPPITHEELLHSLEAVVPSLVSMMRSGTSSAEE